MGLSSTVHSSLGQSDQVPECVPEVRALCESLRPIKPHHAFGVLCKDVFMFSR